MPKVRCITCGFLAKRPGLIDGRYRTPGFFEVDTEDRTKPSTSTFTVLDPITQSAPTADIVCYRGAASLPDEVRARGSNLTREEAFTRVITTERTCERWFEHTPGFDPKEHLAELRLQQGELARAALERRVNRINIWLTAAAIALAAAQVLAAFLTMTPDSRAAKWIGPAPPRRVEIPIAE